MRTWVTRGGIASSLLGIVAWLSSYVFPMKTDASWRNQVLALILGGGGVAAGAQVRTVSKKVGLAVTPEIEPLQLADLKALNHLIERLNAAKDSDGVTKCQELLAKHLFNLHYPNKITK